MTEIGSGFKLEGCERFGSVVAFGAAFVPFVALVGSLFWFCTWPLACLLRTSLAAESRQIWCHIYQNRNCYKPAREPFIADATLVGTFLCVYFQSEDSR